MESDEKIDNLKKDGQSAGLVSALRKMGEDATKEDVKKVRENMDGMKKGPLKRIWHKVQRLWKAFISPDTPSALRALVIGSLIYMVTPIDIVPDYIPFAGLLDDVAIISVVYAILVKSTAHVSIKAVDTADVEVMDAEGNSHDGFVPHISGGGTLVPGDIVATQRMAYMHYGIYIGGGEVVHFNNPDGGLEIMGRSNDIIRSSMEDFLRGDKLYVVREKKGSKYKPFPESEVVERALSCLGGSRGTYNLFGHNCEHFAYWCKYGVHDSAQVSAVMDAAKTVLVAMILG